jgi:two-component system OmpR family response regulator
VRERRPDLLVLDVMMPGRSGLDVVNEIRADAAIADTKIVIVSARAQAADALAAERSGANCFVRKPFSPLELERVVTDLLAS